MPQKIIRSSITLKFKTKPAYLEVDSGFSTLGSFSIATFENGEFVELFPERIKIVNDTIADVFLLPYSPEELEEKEIYIYGKYGPAPTHSQIYVRYNFVQGLDELDPDPEESNLIEEEVDSGAKRFFHSFEFKIK